MSILQINSHSIDQKSGEIWTVQADLQPISFKSDRLLAWPNNKSGNRPPKDTDYELQRDRATQRQDLYGR